MRNTFVNSQFQKNNTIFHEYFTNESLPFSQNNMDYLFNSYHNEQGIKTTGTCKSNKSKVIRLDVTQLQKKLTAVYKYDGVCE